MSACARTVATTQARSSLIPPTFRRTHNLFLLSSHSPSLFFNSTLSLFINPPSQSKTLISSSRPISKACAVRMSSDSASLADSNDRPPLGVLFVCLGNICRSPAAEAVFRSTVQKRGLQSKFKIDSAGTIDYHEGDPADARMRAAALKRGVQVTSISRPIQPSDFENFDYILAMDLKNKEDILKAYKKWNSRQALPADSTQKVKMMCSYCRNHTETEVPDPYYGGTAGFEKVLDLLEDACDGLLNDILVNQA